MVYLKYYLDYKQDYEVKKRQYLHKFYAKRKWKKTADFFFFRSWLEKGWADAFPLNSFSKALLKAPLQDKRDSVSSYTSSKKEECLHTDQIDVNVCFHIDPTVNETQLYHFSFLLSFSPSGHFWEIERETFLNVWRRPVIIIRKHSKH